MNTYTVLLKTGNPFTEVVIKADDFFTGDRMVFFYVDCDECEDGRKTMAFFNTVDIYGMEVSYKE